MLVLPVRTALTLTFLDARSYQDVPDIPSGADTGAGATRDLAFLGFTFRRYLDLDERDRH